MKEFSIPFSLYDFFAILLPGAVGVFGLYLFINPVLTTAGHQAALGNTVLAGLTNQVAFRRYKRLWVETLYAGFITDAKGK